MILKFIDKGIDKCTFLLFNKSRKVGRRLEFTFYTAYRDWLLYTSRRSKDKNVKITMVILTWFTFLSFKTITDLMLMTSIMQYTSPLRLQRQQLDKFNQYGTTRYEELEAQPIELTQKQGEKLMELAIDANFK